MNRLKRLSAYLSGPIDFDPTMGKEWRDDIAEFLTNRGVTVFNPLKHIFEGSQEIDTIKRPRMAQLLKDGKFEELKMEMRELVHFDLRAVDLASFLIVNYDTSIHSCGTIEEISVGNKQQKPILIMAKNGKKKLPSWIYGRMPWQHFFESWDELKEYIVNIDSNINYELTEPDKKRWLFFDQKQIKSNENYLIVKSNDKWGLTFEPEYVILSKTVYSYSEAENEIKNNPMYSGIVGIEILKLE